jgi:hypothetical protein
MTANAYPSGISGTRTTSSGSAPIVTPRMPAAIAETMTPACRNHLEAAIAA